MHEEFVQSCSQGLDQKVIDLIQGATESRRLRGRRRELLGERGEQRGEDAMDLEEAQGGRRGRGEDEGGVSGGDARGVVGALDGGEDGEEDVGGGARRE